MGTDSPRGTQHSSLFSVIKGVGGYYSGPVATFSQLEATFSPRNLIKMCTFWRTPQVKEARKDMNNCSTSTKGYMMAKCVTCCGRIRGWDAKKTRAKRR